MVAVVAFTPTYSLPYWQSTDPPCFGGDCQQDNPFCDFMDIVDERLTAVDDTVARTVTAVPFAKISANGDFFFSTELADNDGMVDLATYNGIVPRRDGVYQIELYAELSAGVTNDLQYLGITIGALTEGWLGTNYIQVASASFRFDTAISPNTAHASTLWLFTSTAPTPRLISAQGNLAAFDVDTVSLSATWVRDTF